MTQSAFRIASAQYPIIRPASLDAWKKNVSQWVHEAAEEEADLLIFPEYAFIDLAGLLDEENLKNCNSMIEALQAFLEEFKSTFAALAIKEEITIVAGSYPVKDGATYTNRSFVFGPKGLVGFQDKMILPRFEREHTFLSAGKELSVFEAPFGTFGVAICYDAQFPIFVRKLVAGGARLLAVPSCTGAENGYNRVRIACLARALENQIPVIHSSTVQEALWNPLANMNYGAAGVFVPSVKPMPNSGVLAIGDMNRPSWVYSMIEPAHFENIRQDGYVQNFKCWDDQKTFKSFGVNHIKTF